MRNRRIAFLLLVVVVTLMLPLLDSTMSQAETSTGARVRIGYFAFHPSQFDTFINGEPDPFGTWLAEVSGDIPPVMRTFLFDLATPFMSFPAGTHSFAFAPKGEGLDAAVLGPEDVTFEDGHSYSLVIVGQLGDGSLNLLVIDETETFSEVDREALQQTLLVHNLVGAPPLDFRVGGGAGAEPVVEDLAYTQYAAFSWPARPSQMQVTIAETRLFGFTYGFWADVSALDGLVGSYPGMLGEDYFWAWNIGYSGEIVVTEGEAISVGDVIDGEIAEVHSRVRHPLAVEADSTLNARVRGTGRTTHPPERSRRSFTPWMFIYDAQGHLLFWIDDIDIDFMPYDSAFKGLELEAGSYFIEVGGVWDIMAGPYELIVGIADGD